MRGLCHLPLTNFNIGSCVVVSPSSIALVAPDLLCCCFIPNLNFASLDLARLAARAFLPPRFQIDTFLGVLVKEGDSPVTEPPASFTNPYTAGYEVELCTITHASPMGQLICCLRIDV